MAAEGPPAEASWLGGRAATERGVQSVQSADAVPEMGENAIRIGGLLTGRACVTLDAFMFQANRENRWTSRSHLSGRRAVQCSAGQRRWTTILPAGRAQCNSAGQRSAVQCSAVSSSPAALYYCSALRSSCPWAAAPVDSSAALRSASCTSEVPPSPLAGVRPTATYTGHCTVTLGPM